MYIPEKQHECYLDLEKHRFRMEENGAKKKSKFHMP